MSERPLILGLESSCDETAAAVVEGAQHVRSNVVATQHDLHARYAGVVPELASRAHLERILPVIREAIDAAGATLNDLDAVAVGNRPGLIGSLLVGVSAAKSVAWSLGVPIVGVDHIRAHLHAGMLSDPGGSAGDDRTAEPPPLATFPALGLVVSGGHTSLFRVPSADTCEPIGRTIDDAIGEAYDKAAVMLGLGYPGGPAVDRLAVEGDDRAHDFPVASLGRDRLDFSYSGLKTALLYAVRGHPVGRGANARFPRDAADLTPDARADFAASFQRAAIRPVIRNLERALKQHPDARTLLVGGGVSANSRLRTELTSFAKRRELTLHLPPMAYCVDNAAMIAGYAAVRLAAGEHDDLSLTAAARA